MEKLAEFIKAWYDESRDFIPSRTSGSTGSPSEIRLNKEDMRLSARATNSFFGITSDSVLGLPLSMDYIAGKMMAVRAIEARCALDVMPVASAVTVRRRYDLLAIVPAQAESLLQCDTAPRLIKNLLLGGAPLSSEMETCLVNAGFNAFMGYGMTETCSHVALRKLGENDGTYKAMPGVHFSVREDGCLNISLQGRKMSYLQTNDMVELLDEHTFRWLGRRDLVINSGGKKLMMEDIERLYASAGLEGRFYVGKIPDEKWGERPVLVIKCGADDVECVRRLLETSIPRLYLPAKIKNVDTLPRNQNGKLIRVWPKDL